MKRTLFFATAIAVAMSSFTSFAASPLYSFANGQKNTKWDGTDATQNKYGVPNEDIVSVGLDVKSAWEGDAPTDHSSIGNPLNPGYTKRNATQLKFDASAELDLSSVAAEWNSYIDAGMEYAARTQGQMLDELTDEQRENLRSAIINKVNVTGDFSIVIKTNGNGTFSEDATQSTLVGIANPKLEAKDISAIAWRDTSAKVPSSNANESATAVNTLTYFEYLGDPEYSYDSQTGDKVFTVNMKTKSDSDLGKKLDKYFTALSNAVSKSAYNLIANIGGSYVGDTVAGKATHSVTAQFLGKVSLSLPTLESPAVVYFGTSSSDATGYVPAEDTEYITLAYSTRGGGGGGGGSSSGDSTSTSTQSPTQTSKPTQEPTQTSNPTGTETPATQAPVVTPGTSSGAKLNYGDHYAYIIGYDVEGSDIDEIRPTANITRAEVATIFFRLMTDESRERFITKDNTFSDVNVNDWFDTAISTAAKAGIVNGYETGDFRPNNAITRAEFAKIAANFAGETASNGVDFNDIANHWAAEDIRKAASIGWVTGYDDGSFKPEQKITRAEAVTIINRVLYRLVNKSGLSSDMITWLDNDPNAWYYADMQESSNSHSYSRKDIGYKETWTEMAENPDWETIENSGILNYKVNVATADKQKTTEASDQ